MADNKLLIRFWGVRGSHPVPGPSTVKYGGNTSCVEVRAGGHLIILDAGTGIIPLGSRLRSEFGDGQLRPGKLTTTILISHMHHDHIQGLPFFEPAYDGDARLYIFAPRIGDRSAEEALTLTMNAPYFPLNVEELQASKSFNDLEDSKIISFEANSNGPHVAASASDLNGASDSLVIRAHWCHAHPKEGIFNFSIEYGGKKVVYATDTESEERAEASFCRFANGADVLIHDAMYEDEEYHSDTLPKQGYGHSTLGMASKVAEATNSKLLVLFHHDPTHDDGKIDSMEDRGKQMFKNTVAAFEGMELKL